MLLPFFPLIILICIYSISDYCYFKIHSRTKIFSLTYMYKYKISSLKYGKKVRYHLKKKNVCIATGHFSNGTTNLSIYQIWEIVLKHTSYSYSIVWVIVEDIFFVIYYPIYIWGTKPLPLYGPNLATPWTSIQ